MRSEKHVSVPTSNFANTNYSNFKAFDMETEFGSRQYSSLMNLSNKVIADACIYIWVWLTCALRAHIKLFIFRNILSRVEKIVITFSILEKFFFPKMEINVCPKGTH